MESFSRRTVGDGACVCASTLVTLSDYQKNNKDEYVKLDEAGGLADGLGDADLITFNMTMDDGTARTFDIKTGASKRDLLVQTLHNAVTIPSASVQLGSRGSYVYLVKQEEQAGDKVVVEDAQYCD